MSTNSILHISWFFQITPSKHSYHFTAHVASAPPRYARLPSVGVGLAPTKQTLLPPQTQCYSTLCPQSSRSSCVIPVPRAPLTRQTRHRKSVSGTAWLVAVGTSGTRTHPVTSRLLLSNGRAVNTVYRGLAGRPAGSDYRPSGPPASRHAFHIVWQCHAILVRGKWNDTLSVPTRALVPIRVDTPRPPFPDRRGHSRTPTKHRIIRTTIRRPSRGETSPNSRLCRRVVERRRRVGGVSCSSDFFPRSMPEPLLLRVGQAPTSTVGRVAPCGRCSNTF